MIQRLITVAVLAGGSLALASGLDLLPSAPSKTERGFTIHTQESAPKLTQEVLGWYQENFGFVPNLAGVMAESPALSRSYWQLQLNLQAHGTLSPAEDNVVQMAIAFENECQYCVAGHAMAGKMFFGSSEAELAALRSGAKLPTKKQDVLRAFALEVAESKGRVDSEQLERFLAAGYTRAQALDVVANVAAKTMSNFTNQLVKTPLDAPIAPFAKGLPFAEERGVVSRD